LRVVALKFAGYASGETDFGSLLSRGGQGDLETLEFVIGGIAEKIVNSSPGVYVSIIVTGHSDRNDTEGLSCDDRRRGESQASWDRAGSALEWIKARVAEKCSEQGVDAGEWWEHLDWVTWALVPASTAMLEYDPPRDEQRPLNRRVVILLSAFPHG
jgi:hypothetical protein